MNTYRHALELGLAEVRDGRLAEALAYLQPSLAQAIKARNREWASLLARNVSIVFEQLGDDRAGLRVLQDLDSHQLATARDIYAIAETAQRIGDPVMAQQYLQECLRRGAEEGDDDLNELARGKMGFPKRFPEPSSGGEQ